MGYHEKVNLLENTIGISEYVADDLILIIETHSELKSLFSRLEESSTKISSRQNDCHKN